MRWFAVLLIILLLLTIGTPAFAQTSLTLFRGTGQAVSASPDLNAMVRSAATEAKNAYNASGGTNSPPKVIIIMNNIYDSGTVVTPAIQSVFGTTIPILGSEDGWADYTPYTIDQMPGDSANRSFSIMALGGSAISVSWATGVGDFNSNNDSQAVVGGKNLATKLGPPVESKNNLILIMGPLHGTLGESAVSGIKQVYGSPLPSNVKIIGWAGSYWGASVYDNGVRKGNQMLGIKIVGDYTWAFRGIDHGNLGWDGSSGPDGGDPVASIGKFYSQITSELHMSPVVSFMVIAHPDRSLFPAIRDKIFQTVGSISMIGMHGGSETGHDTTSGDVIAEGSHFFLAGLGLPINNSTITPAATITPP